MTVANVIKNWPFITGIWEFERSSSLKILTGLVVKNFKIPCRQLLRYSFLSQLENLL